MTPFETKIEQLSKIKRIMMKVKVLNKLKDLKFGLPQSNVEVIEYNADDKITKMADRKNDGYYYYYTGPESERDFCKIILKLDKVFSEDDINALTILTGYDVFEYQPGPIMPNGGPGGPNCRHGWIRFRGKFINTPAPTDRQIANIANNNIFNK